MKRKIKFGFFEGNNIDFDALTKAFEDGNDDDTIVDDGNSNDDATDTVINTNTDDKTVNIGDVSYELDDSGNAIDENGEIYKSKEELDKVTTDTSNDDVDDDDPFNDVIKDLGLSEEEIKIEFNYNDIVNEFELSLEEGAEVNSQNILSAIKNKIETASTKPNLDDFSPEARIVIEHLQENGGTLQDFANDNIMNEMTSFLKSSAEEKVRSVRFEKLLGAGMDRDTASDTVDTIIDNMSEAALNEEAKQLDNKAIEIRNERIKLIADKRNEYFRKEEEKLVIQAERERGEMKNQLKSITEFYGLPLNDKVKKAVETAIDNGQMDKILNKNLAQAKLMSFLEATLGNQARKLQNERLKNAVDSTRKDEKIKSIKERHNIDHDAGGQGSSVGTRSKAGDNNYDAWSEIL